MTTHPVTICQVLHPTNGEVVALEITTNNGATYFVVSDPAWPGIRVGRFPNRADGTPLERIEIARLP